jgi:hypothetical protein
MLAPMTNDDRPTQRPPSLKTKLIFGALLGIIGFRSDACICGGGHRPEPAQTPVPSASAPVPQPAG